MRRRGPPPSVLLFIYAAVIFRNNTERGGRAPTAPVIHVGARFHTVRYGLHTFDLHLLLP